MTAPPSKLPDVGTTIFTVMSTMAAEYGAINLSQGFPDFAAPEKLVDLVARHLRAGQNQYAPMAGVPELRAQIAAKTEHMYGRITDADTEITVTSGATSALFSAILAFVSGGDEVVVFDPAYDAYDPVIRLAGGRAVHVPLSAPEFSVDWTRVADTINDNTRMIILNTPHNPSGSVLHASDMTALAQIVENTDILLLSDEVYEHIIFDGQRHESLLRYPDLIRRGLTVSSFGKTYHATGWKIGYCVGPAQLMDEFRRIHQFVQFSVVTPMQYALAEYLADAPEHYTDLPSFYQSKRDLFCRLLETSRFQLTPSAGTYFQMADYSEISAQSDVDFAVWMTREVGVACIPVSVFYQDQPPHNLLRFCFAKHDETLERAAELLCAI